MIYTMKITEEMVQDIVQNINTGVYASIASCELQRIDNNTDAFFISLDIVRDTEIVKSGGTIKLILTKDYT